MRTRRGQSFLQGAVILTAATMLVKLIGMLYKIPLGNILGAGGMSYFMSAYSVFNPVYALSVSGFPAAVSRLVSEQNARRKMRDVRRIRGVSFALFLVLGLAGSLLLFFGARFFSQAIGNPEAVLSVAAIAPSVLFCCLMSSWRGYYQGLGNMTPTAVSQVMESLARLVFGILGAWYVMRYGLGQFEQTGRVFGQLAATSDQAQLMVLPWAAAGAVLGVSASTAVGVLVLFLRSTMGGDGIKRQELAEAPEPEHPGVIVRKLLRFALPVCVASAFAHVTAVIDVITIMNRIGVAVATDAQTVLGMYRGVIPPALPVESLPSYLYGAYGYTSSLFNLVPSITVALGISVLPVISARRALGDSEYVASAARSVIKLAGLIAIPAGLGLFVLARPILTLLYPMRVTEVAIAESLLRTMGLGAVMVGITTPVNSVFQALGRADIPLKLMAGGAALKLAANWTLLAIPSINIAAAPIGTLLCYAFVLFGGAIALRTVAEEPVGMLSVLIKPLLCGILCAVTANTCYMLVSRIWDSRLTVLISIAAGGSIYVVFVLLLKIITKNEAMFLPNGKKVAKILEKLDLLG